MSAKTSDTSPSPKSIDLKPKSPYVFLSHDSRDADIAEAFARLLASVTAGVLKCFRSSDKKGGQGIEYGVEWFPELMKKLQDATDVVCLLTENSLNRPWILFEAGVAKGKLDTPILGLALGIPLSTANTGPFAQFQNSDDEEDSLVKLVTQLVRKIPGAEPDDSVVRQQVITFKGRIVELSKKAPAAKTKEQKKELEESASVAKLFEEIKVMFNDLPARLDLQISSVKRRRPRRLHPELFEELSHMRHRSPILGFVTALAFIRDDIPWVYDVGRELIQAARRGNESEIKEIISSFHNVLELSIHHPMLVELYGERVDLPRMEEFADLLHHLAEDVPLFAGKSRK